MCFQCLTTYETMARMDSITRWLRGCCLGNDPQIVRDHAPADPAFHPSGAVIAAAVQFLAPFQPTDPALNPRTPVVALPEPPLLLMRNAFRRFGSWLGQHHLLDPVRGGIPLVRSGVDPAICSEQAGRALEHPPMMVQTRWQLRVLCRVAL